MPQQNGTTTTILIPPATPAPTPAELERNTSSNSTGRPRRSSFSFLRRSKSGEMRNGNNTGSVANKLTRRRKSVSKDEEARRREEAAADRKPPQLPSLHSQLDSTSLLPPDAANPTSSLKPGAYDPAAYYARYSSMDRNAAGSPPSSAGPAQMAGQQPFDPYARTESMTNRGRYSYASSAVSLTNSPRRLRRRKDPTPFNVLVVGTKSSGKTSFIEFLRSALNRPIKPRVTDQAPAIDAALNPVSSADGSSFVSQYLETDLEGERIGFTLWDSKGLETHLVDLQLREISAFIESKFQETFNEEQKVMRATNVTDTHIHCVFLVLDPSRLDGNTAASGAGKAGGRAKAGFVGCLDEQLDVDVIRTLQGKTTIVPVISKADTITTAHMSHLKRTLTDSFRKIKFDPLELLNLDPDNDSDLDEEDEDALEEILEENKALSSAQTNGSADSSSLPFSIISPDVYDPGTIGRRFPWGFADPYNPQHCDFVRLKDSVFNEWRSELRLAARERWYEGWRTTRLRKRGQMSSMPPPSSVLPASSSTGGRVVSAAAAYGNPVERNNLGVKKDRVVSASEIGVAIGGDTPLASNAATSAA